MLYKSLYSLTYQEKTPIVHFQVNVLELLADQASSKLKLISDLLRYRYSSNGAIYFAAKLPMVDLVTVLSK